MSLEMTAVMADIAISDNGDIDPMSRLELLPEVSIAVASLVPWFHLRQTGTDAAHVRLLADAAASVKLPPILVQRRNSRIIDGIHRVEVARLRGECSINARIVDCTDEEALVLAIKSNTLHGLPLSRADRISGAKRLLVAHPDWSDRAVAGITGLSGKAIASLRNMSGAEVQFHGKRLGRDGKRRPVMPGEGRLRAAEYIRANPQASLRQVARNADVSLGTAHDVRDSIRRGADPAVRGQERPAEPVQGIALARTGPAGPPLRSAPVIPPVRPLPARGAGRYGQQLTWPAIAAKLAGDPALRYTEGGRAFLRWMSQHSALADEWLEFIDSIPPHWQGDVGRVALSMSEEWRQFGERLGAGRCDSYSA
jgi:hypothetical protein